MIGEHVPGREMEVSETRLSNVKSWGDYSTRDAIATIKQMYKWEEQMKISYRRALSEMLSPIPDPRDRVISTEEHYQFLQGMRSSSN